MKEESEDYRKGGLDLSHVTEVPGADVLQNAINDFNKKAAGALWNSFKRVLGTVTEPFFRAGMGERYYTNDTHWAGISLWVAGTIVGWVFPSTCLTIVSLCMTFHLHSAAIWFNRSIFAVMVGSLMIAAQLLFGWQNLRLMGKYRAEGAPYHSRSRGISRWQFLTVPFALALFAILFLFNLPIGVVFLLGVIMNSKIKSDQDAAILDRYLDTMDADMENEHLYDSALGKCPTELAYLYKPISDKYKPEVKTNIAASLVGKPVAGVAKSRQRRKSPTDGALTATSKSGNSQAEQTQGSSEPPPGSPPPNDSTGKVGDIPAVPANGSTVGRVPTTLTSPVEKAPLTTGGIFTPETLRAVKFAQSLGAAPDGKTEGDTFPPEFRQLMSLTFHPTAIDETMRLNSMLTGFEGFYDVAIRHTVAYRYETAKYGTTPPPRSTTHVGEESKYAPAFAPDVLDLLQKILDAEQIETLVMIKAAHSCFVPSDDLLIRGALRIGYEKNKLANFCEPSIFPLSKPLS